MKKLWIVGVLTLMVYLAGCGGNGVHTNPWDAKETGGEDIKLMDTEGIEGVGGEVDEITNETVNPDVKPEIRDIQGDEAGGTDIPGGDLDVISDEVTPGCKTDDDCADVEHTVCQTVKCNTETGQCEVKNKPDYTACDDKDPCTLRDYCLEGKCTPGVKKDCDDKNPCTVDKCESDGSCSHASAKNGTACDDGNPFTENDQCEDGKCVGTPTKECKTDNDCGLVDPNDVCKGRMKCNTQTGKCVVDPGTVITCLQDPQDQCNIRVCNPKTGQCEVKPKENGTACEDGLLCTVGDTCQDGKCVSGENKCPQCENDTDCAGFDDGNACNGIPLCENGTCVKGKEIECEQVGDDICGMNVCDVATGKCKMEYQEDGSACVKDVCKVGQTCSQGQCIGGEERSCDDGNPCTKDMCDADKGGCYHETIEGCKACKKVEDCDDGNDCTEDKCVNDVCVWNKLTGTDCDDGDPCTVGDKCDNGVCQKGMSKKCDDNDVCTADSCDPQTGECVFKHIDGCEYCDNGKDDNGNGWVDCDDSYCKDNQLCKDIAQGDMCVNPFLIRNGEAFKLSDLGNETHMQFTGNTNKPDFTDNYQATCLSTPGAQGKAADVVYKFVLAEPMRVKVTFDFKDTPGNDLYPVVYIYKDVCSADHTAGCKDGDGSKAVIDTTLQAGTYYVVGDGAFGVADQGEYTITFDFSEVPSKETDCNNGVDDDLDGKTDCLDEDCAQDAGCKPCDVQTELSCDTSYSYELPSDNTRSNEVLYGFSSPFDGSIEVTTTTGNENDRFSYEFYKDTKQGCDDKALISKVNAGEPAELEVERGTDYYIGVKPENIADTTISYNIVVKCSPSNEFNCADSKDEDKDSLTDCADPDCFNNAVCTGGHSGESCDDPFEINDGKPVDVTNGDVNLTYYNTTADKKNDLSGSCSDASKDNPEVVYKVVLAAKAKVNVDVKTTTDGYKPVMYVMTDSCNKERVCAESTDTGSAAVSGTWEAGTYFIVVDGENTGSFELDFHAKALPAIEDCSKTGDEDHDDLADCSDPDCFADEACTGGHSGKDCSDPFVLKDTALVAGDNITKYNTTAGASDDYSGSCGGTNAPDVVYTFSLQSKLKVSVKVSMKGFATPVFYIYKDQCGQSDAQQACALGTGNTAEWSDTLNPGKYFVVVDGTKQNGGIFELNVKTEQVQVSGDKSCWDGKDDDGNSKTDCNDDTCKEQPICTATTCMPAITVNECNKEFDLDNYDKDWTNAVDAFKCNGNDMGGYGDRPEYTAKFVAPCDTDVTISWQVVQASANMQLYDGYVLDSGDTCDPTKCIKSQFGDPSSTNTLTFTAQKDHVYYIVLALSSFGGTGEDKLKLKVDCSCASSQTKPAKGDVIFTEVMANPAGSDTGTEYFEVYNTTDHDLDLAGCTITGKTDSEKFDIAPADDGLHDTLIPAHGYLVFGASDVIKHIIPSTAKVYVYNGRNYALSNTRDILGLVCGDTEIDTFSYDSKPPTNSSLQLIPDKFNATDNDYIINWCPTARQRTTLIKSDDNINFPYNPDYQNFGTPGAENLSTCTATPEKPEPGEMIFTEIMPDPASNDANKQYVELYNKSPFDLELNNCSLQTNEGEVNLTDVIVQSGQYLVVGREEHVSTAVGEAAVFFDSAGSLKLAHDADQLILSCNEVTIDKVSYDTTNGWKVTEGYSLNLDPEKYSAEANDAADAWCTATSEINGDYNDDKDNDNNVLVNYGSPGAKNDTCASIPLIFTEVMANPKASPELGLEYFELYNRSDKEVDLTGCVVTSNNGGEAFTIQCTNDGDHDCKVPAGGYIVFGSSDKVKAVINQGSKFYNYEGQEDGGKTLSLKNSSDDITITCDQKKLVAFKYNRTTNGESWTLDPAYYDKVSSQDQKNTDDGWCVTPKQTEYQIGGNDFSDQDYGTPGKQGPACQ